MSSRLWDADMSVQALEDLGLIGPLEWVPYTPEQIAAMKEDEKPEDSFDAYFTRGDRVLYAPTGEWATVVDSYALESGVTFDNTGTAVVYRKNGDLIPENDVDPDPDDRGEGEVIYKVEIGEKDLYTDDYEAAETAYNLAVNAGEDHCRVWVQTWYEDVDDPDEDIILSNSPN